MPAGEIKVFAFLSYAKQSLLKVRVNIFEIFPGSRDGQADIKSLCLASRPQHRKPVAADFVVLGRDRTDLDILILNR